MKRSPLKRKTPLKSNVPLKRSTKPLKASKPLKKVSTKQAAKLRNYAKLRAIHMEANPFCAICGAVATDLHHRKGRGIYLDDPEWFLSVCREDHNRIHNNPNQARKDGWIIN